MALTARPHRLALWSITLAAQGLAVASLALAPPAQAHGDHHHATAGHSSSAPAHPHHTVANTAGASTQPRATANAQPAQQSSAPRPKGDKCKMAHGGKGLPPWCTDPVAGFMSSTTHRAEPSYLPFYTLDHQSSLPRPPRPPKH